MPAIKYDEIHEKNEHLNFSIFCIIKKNSEEEFTNKKKNISNMIPEGGE
jgi:hypothetical protein